MPPTATTPGGPGYHLNQDSSALSIPWWMYIEMIFVQRTEITTHSRKILAWGVSVVIRNCDSSIYHLGFRYNILPFFFSFLLLYWGLNSGLYNLSCAPAFFLFLVYFSVSILFLLGLAWTTFWSSHLCLLCSWDYRYILLQLASDTVSFYSATVTSLYLPRVIVNITSTWTGAVSCGLEQLGMLD
jgi:hypothetical protein